LQEIPQGLCKEETAFQDSYLPDSSRHRRGQAREWGGSSASLPLRRPTCGTQPILVLGATMAAQKTTRAEEAVRSRADHE